MDQGFGVALASVDMATLFKLTSQFTVVVNFPVKSNPNRAVLIGHGLMTATEVYDGKAAMAKSDRIADPSSGIIRTSMCKSLAHCRDLWLLHSPLQPQWVNQTADRTHRFTIPSNRIQECAEHDMFRVSAGISSSSICASVCSARRLKKLSRSWSALTGTI